MKIRNPKLDNFKKQTALRSVEFVESGMILGLGTGSTFYYALQEIGRKLAKGELEDIIGISSSKQTAQFARALQIPLISIDDLMTIDMTIDGADEVDPQLNLIKGGHGALMREKVLAQASERNIIIVDESKVVKQLGSKGTVPVEVLPFAWRIESEFIESLGAAPELRKDKTGQFLVTDQGNYIIDCDFGPINNPSELSIKLNQRAGIMENGLFIGLATDVIVAGEGGIRHLRK
jgi:ribose 5-phosphate isomerase A